MNIKFHKILLFAAVIITFSFGMVFARQIIKIEGIHSGDLKALSFEMTDDGEIWISAVGAEGQFSDGLICGGWIIDAYSRLKVWRMNMGNTNSFGNSDELRKYEGNLKLKKGKYEVYYYASANKMGNIDIKGPGELFKFLGKLFSGRAIKDRYKSFENLYLEIKGDASVFRLIDNPKSFAPDYARKPVLLQYTELGDNVFKKVFFSITKRTNIHIYMIGEYSRSGRRMVDGGWITDLNTGEKVWEATRWNTDFAGGARKNRVFDDDVNFPAGDYELVYITDDSHSFEGWNDLPPSDPYFWGITISGGKNYKKGDFQLTENPHISKPLLKIIKMGNNEFRQESFKLKKNAKLRIYCFGEYSISDGEFVDYGWIEDNSTHETVWKLNWDNSEFGGGSEKNRVFDGIINLPKGSYTVHYLTDDSHSYNHWNASPPFDPNNYGISICGVGKTFDPKSFEILEGPEEGVDILVRMVGLGDDVNRFESFELTKPTKIHIYSIGEGDRTRMYDYGWIERMPDRRVVWEMTYRNTNPAGGARKNRMYDDNIILDRGKYRAYFITDGSHSFEEWNAPKPRDPADWGITITKSIK